MGEEYWLYSDEPTYSFEILYISVCKICKREFMDWYGVLAKGGRSALNRIPFRHFDRWKTRVKTDLAYKALEGHRRRDPVMIGPVVSDYTKLISMDPADVFEKVLRR